MLGGQIKRGFTARRHFAYEERLQELLAFKPEVLDEGPFAAGRMLLGREISFGSEKKSKGPAPDDGHSKDRTHRPDIYFIERDGTPCIVEVKLSGNRTMPGRSGIRICQSCLRPT